ncbi:MAG: diguanylate cyclase [Armatimonadetes bacterium]|nr:diguanylate cyclase [Armatimonadota bacterium]
MSTTLADFWPKPVVLVEGDGVVLFANGAFCELLEVEPTSLVGTTLWDAVGLDSTLRLVRKAIDDARAGTTSQPLEWAASLPSGREIFFRGVLSAYVDGKAAFAMDDVSVERELARKLAESLAADEALIASLPTTLLQIDYQGSLVRLCDNGNIVADESMSDGFLWTMALPTGLGEAVCDASAVAKLEQRAVRFRHSHDDRHLDVVVTPCGMSDTLVVVHDVTDSVLLDRAKKDALDRMRVLVEGSDNILALLDENLCLTYVSPASQWVLGLSEAELSGRHFADFFVDNAELSSFLDKVLSMSPAQGRDSFSFKKADGRIVRLEIDARNRLADPLVGSIVINAHDLTELLELQERLEERVIEVEDRNMDLVRQATTDALTGLHNYFSFQEHFKQAVAQMEREATQLSVVLIDVDHFKNVNDTHGHLAGDNVLREVARRIKVSCRKSDVVARYGGEEFVVLLPGTGRAGATHVGDTIREAVQSAPIDGLAVTVSVGVATEAQSHLVGAAMLRNADSAMYHSKRTGRNRTTHAADLGRAA